MRQKIVQAAEKFVNLEIIGLAFLLPLFFLPITTEFFDFNKLALLTVLVVLGVLAWGLKTALTGDWGMRRSPFDLPVILILIVTIISTIFSDSWITSIIGQYARWHPSLFSVLIFTALYFLISGHINEKTLRRILWALLFSSVIAVLAFWPHYFGANLLGQDWSNRPTFTPLGSPTVLALFLGSVAGVVLRKIIESQNRWVKIALAADLVFLAATLTLLGNAAGGLAFAVSLATAILITPIAILAKNKLHLASAVAAILVFVAVVFVPPLFGKSTFLNREFPQEINLDLNTSWSVSATSFRQKPFWGSGPSTFLSDFTRYKPLRFNQNQFWTIRFGKPINEYLLAFGEGGLIGIAAWIILITIFVRESLRRKGWETMPIGAAILAGLLLTNATIVSAALLTIALATLNPKREMEAENEVKSVQPLGWKAILLLAMVIILNALVLLWAYPVYEAEYWQRKSRTTDSLVQAYNFQVKGAARFPWQTNSRISLAQTNFLVANELAKKKNPTADEQQQIQNLIARAISEAREATNLSPLSTESWENLAQIYRSLIGLAKDAEKWSADSYQKAITLDLFNPLLRISFGGLYYQIKEFELATEQFRAAVNLKPDYANAHFNLGRAYKEMKEKDLAIQEMETALRLSDPQVAGYEEAKQVLDELKKSK